MAQITEDYVSFLTAKLLKEKGFDEECIYVYRHDGSEDTWDADKEDIACQKPTLQMAMKWLREKEIVIVIKPYPNEDGFAYAYEIKRLIGRDDFKTRSVRPENSRAGYDSYEEATEAAIMYCLENLI